LLEINVYRTVIWRNLNDLPEVVSTLPVFVTGCHSTSHMAIRLFFIQERLGIGFKAGIADPVAAAVQQRQFL
jgi:hypothetical protein